MKLVDLVRFFREGGVFEDFCCEQGLGQDSEVIEIFAQEPVCLESPLGFFPIEETEGRVDFQFEGVRYRNLFDFLYFADVIQDVVGSSEPSNQELAQRLLSYATNDA